MRRTDETETAGAALIVGIMSKLREEMANTTNGALARRIGELAACGIGLELRHDPNQRQLTAAYEMATDGEATAAVELTWPDGSHEARRRWRGRREAPWRTPFANELGDWIGHEQRMPASLPRNGAAEALAGIEPLVREIVTRDEWGLLAKRRPLRAAIACATQAKAAIDSLNRWQEEGLGLGRIMAELGELDTAVDLRWGLGETRWEGIEIVRVTTDGYGGWDLETHPAVNAMRSERDRVGAMFSLEERGNELRLQIDQEGEACIGFWKMHRWVNADREWIQKALESLAHHPEAQRPDVLVSAADQARWPDSA